MTFQGLEMKFMKNNARLSRCCNNKNPLLQLMRFPRDFLFVIELLASSLQQLEFELFTKKKH